MVFFVRTTGTVFPRQRESCGTHNDVGRKIANRLAASWYLATVAKHESNIIARQLFCQRDILGPEFWNALHAVMWKGYCQNDIMAHFAPYICGMRA
jgi:hypothetical protein